MFTRLKDKLWIRQSFMLPDGAISDIDQKRRLETTAAFKFTDTTLGGNFAVNAPPSYCRYADPRMGGGVSAGREAAFMRSTGTFRTTASNQDYEDEIERQVTSPSSGMGQYYSEAIDDNAQIAIMRFGVPAFNSLTQFFGNFYHPEAAQMARTARASDNVIASFFVGAAGAAGSLLGGMLALPFQPVILLAAFWRNFSFAPPSKFYYLKPAMFPYWSAVQTIVNGIGVNLGIVPYSMSPGQRKVAGAEGNEFSPQNYAEYARLMPDLLTPDGFIDVYAFSTKAQRRANRFNTKIQTATDSATSTLDLASKIRAVFDGMAQDRDTDPASYKAYLNRFYATEVYKTGGGGGAGEAAGGGEAIGGDAGTGSQNTASAESLEPIGDKSHLNFGSAFYEFLQGELRDGSNFISLRVDYTGTSSESFNNETGESSIAQKLNSASASARSARFDVADGNIGMGLGAVVDSVKAFATNMLDSVQLSGLAALFGSAFVDIPHVWQSSVAQLPSANFTMQLRSPYANKLSQMQNLYIPLAMILAGGLPLAAGKQAYTSPFICELYCKGRVNIRLGIIDSISIERGVGNVGWNQDGHALGIDVSFSVKDLSTVMSVPVANQFTAMERGAATAASALGISNLVDPLIKSMYDDENTFTDYLATLGGLSFQDMVYAGRRWNLNRARLFREVERTKSPAYWAAMAGGTLPGRIVNALSIETDRSGRGGT